MNILLIEDDLVDQMAFRRWMSKELNACQLSIANSLEEFEKVISNSDFDAFVCDYHLPDGDLLDVTKLVDPSAIICISGLVDPVKIEGLKAAGVPTFLFKDNQLDYLDQFKEHILKLHNVQLFRPKKQLFRPLLPKGY